MQESDYFEDFGEGNEDAEDNESERPTAGKKGKKGKSKGKDKLMGELEFLALGEDDKVPLLLCRLAITYVIDVGSAAHAANEARLRLTCLFRVIFYKSPAISETFHYLTVFT